MTKLKEQIMEKINKGDVKMKPKEFFVAAKVLLLLLIGSALAAAAFFVNLVFYHSRRGMPGPGFWSRFSENLPWSYILFAVLLLFVAVFLIEKFTEAYQKRIIYVVLFILVLVVSFGFLISNTNLNRRFENRPGLRNFYHERGTPHKMDRQGPGWQR